MRPLRHALALAGLSLVCFVVALLTHDDYDAPLSVPRVPEETSGGVFLLYREEGLLEVHYLWIGGGAAFLIAAILALALRRRH